MVWEVQSSKNGKKHIQTKINVQNEQCYQQALLEESKPPNVLKDKCKAVHNVNRTEDCVEEL